MCNDRRATFQRIDMSGPQPKATYSFNPTAIQFWIWTVMKVTGIIVGIVLGMTVVSETVFHRELEMFHREAKPAIDLLMDRKIAAEREAIARSVESKVHALELSATTQKQKLEAIQEKSADNAARLIRIEDKIDKLLQNGDH